MQNDPSTTNHEVSHLKNERNKILSMLHSFKFEIKKKKKYHRPINLLIKFIYETRNSFLFRTISKKDISFQILFSKNVRYKTRKRFE